MHLERPLALGQRLDGHLVLGHVDDVGVVLAPRREGETLYFSVSVPSALLPMCAPQGSITLAGVSLTVVGVAPDRRAVTVALVPHTLEQTILAAYSQGARINIEVDVLARYVHRMLQPDGAGTGDAAGSVTRAMLEDQGFA